MGAVVGTDGEPLEDEISSHFYMTPKLSAYMRLMWGRDTSPPPSGRAELMSQWACKNESCESFFMVLNTATYKLVVVLVVVVGEHLCDPEPSHEQSRAITTPVYK